MATPPSDPLSTAEHPLSVSSVPQGIAHAPTAGPPAQAIPPVPSTQASSTSTNTLKSNLNSNTVPIYTFKFYNAGNNQITCMTDPSLPKFTITTTRGFLDLPNHSVVICTVPGVDGARNVAQGELDWNKEKITVGNVSKSMKEAKKRIGGVLSLNTQWTWPSGEYTIKRSALTYTATRGGQEVAAYTTLEEKVFSKNELATLRFFVDMPYEERVFLIFALLIHDLLKRPVPEPKSLGETALDVGVSVATTAATNAITGCCCVVQ